MNTIASQFAQHPAGAHARTIKTIDAHTGGEPLRIITSGFPQLNGQTILEKRRDCQQRFDDLRTALMFEPRGHADMYGALVVEPERPDSDFGAIFIHNEGYSTMCGHAVIALTKLAVESGVVAATGEVTKVVIDVPCGQIIAHAYQGQDGLIDRVSFDCVPSFVVAQNQRVLVEGCGEVAYDLAFGGAYYAYVQAASVGLTCTPADYDQLIQIGRRIKAAVSQQQTIRHPGAADLSFLYGTIFVDEAVDPEVHSRNVCVFADGEVDRSPTGSGVSGRIAIHVAKNEVVLGQKLLIESIIGSRFEVEATRTLDYHGHQAVIPRVTGQAFITGKHEFIIDPQDELARGFILR